jgi:GNAT superfamily N-acetyltransferase
VADRAIQVLNKTHAATAGELMSSVFAEDPGVQFMFPSPKTRDRWLTPVLTVEAQFVIGYGQATGLWQNGTQTLAGVGLWYLPHRPFPPPWYRMLFPALPLLPLQLRLPTLRRLGLIHQFYLSLLPKDRRALYLEGLAVQPEHQGQGLGRQLVEWGQGHARLNQCPVILHCWETMVDFYRGLGFSSQAEGQLKGLDVPCHLMCWNPDPDAAHR